VSKQDLHPNWFSTHTTSNDFTEKYPGRIASGKIHKCRNRNHGKGWIKQVIPLDNNQINSNKKLFTKSNKYVE
jgi:hypothetical protein